jgi:hypothetical protein
MFNDEVTHLKNVRTRERKYKRLIYAHGPGQILYKTALSKEVGYKGSEKGLDNETISIPLAIKYIAHLQRAYHGSWAKTISHYKSGNPSHSRFYKRLYPKYLKLTDECL